MDGPGGAAAGSPRLSPCERGGADPPPVAGAAVSSSLDGHLVDLGRRLGTHAPPDSLRAKLAGHIVGRPHGFRRLPESDAERPAVLTVDEVVTNIERLAVRR